jgi:hypothetical protein
VLRYATSKDLLEHTCAYDVYSRVIRGARGGGVFTGALYYSKFFYKHKESDIVRVLKVPAVGVVHFYGSKRSDISGAKMFLKLIFII